MAAHFFVPGRKHKVPKVDFNNPFLREYLKEWPSIHAAALGSIKDSVPGWVKRSAGLESSEKVPRPLAAVLDIDELVLNNIHLNTDGDFHAADVVKWPRGHKYNPLLPGALPLLEELRKNCVSIFFVTGRLESIREETVQNFVEVGLCSEEKAAARCLFAAKELLDAKGPLLMCPDSEYPTQGQSIRSYKEQQRAQISKTHRIILNVGDQPSDLGFHGDMQLLVPHPFYWVP